MYGWTLYICVILCLFLFYLKPITTQDINKLEVEELNPSGPVLLYAEKS